MIKEKELTKILFEKYDLREEDVYLVDELYFHFSLLKMCKLSIKQDGLQINVSKDPNKPYYQVNQAVTTYQSALKNILNITRKLGLSPLDRKTLNLQPTNNEEDDGFDD